MTKQYVIQVYGRVQGVGFRYSARNRARSLKLKGYVENRPDGSVRTVVEGEEKACREYIRWCREGPGYSWVEKIEVDEKEPEGLDHFHVRY